LKPEILVSLTASHGIALDGSRGATPLELAEEAAWFKPGRGGQDGTVRWSSNKATRSSKPATWSLAECALACRGLDERYHLALRFTYALDDSVIYRLRAALVAFAERRSRVEKWPATVYTDKGRLPYLQALVDLVLLEDRRPSLFIKAPKGGGMGRPRIMHAVILGITTDLWRRCVEPKFEAVRIEYIRWLGVGTGHMRRALRDEGIGESQ
jgi:hypothetical protein